MNSNPVAQSRGGTSVREEKKKESEYKRGENCLGEELREKKNIDGMTTVFLDTSFFSA